MEKRLIDLGLTIFFTQQLNSDEIEAKKIARVSEVRRNRVVVTDGTAELVISLGNNWFKYSAEHRPTVGDWVILDDSREKIVRLLERKTVFRRGVPGTKAGIQLIAANIDTLFIVSSCNDEFNESRLERYLALAVEAGVDPVIVLTKSDLTPVFVNYLDRAKKIKPDLPVESVNALDPSTLQKLRAWINIGSTIALVGSSGVGKSTLVNSLAGAKLADTGSIREDDARGRHTTTHRALHLLSGGGLLLDVPGMRELKVANLDKSLDKVFDDIESLSMQCKFGNCSHSDEPRCAVRDAIDKGQISQRRLSNYQKLAREDLRNTSTLAEQRHQNRQRAKKAKLDFNERRKLLF